MKGVEFFIVFMVLTFFLLGISCKKDSGREVVCEIPSIIDSEVNVEKIKENIGFSFNILKTKTIKSSSTYKFLWICLEYELETDLLEKLTYAIIRDVIDHTPGTYDSIIIHIFKKRDLRRTVEKSFSFAKAEYLPKNGWSWVGRTPISEYENYHLVISFYDQ